MGTDIFVVKTDLVKDLCGVDGRFYRSGPIGSEKPDDTESAIVRDKNADEA
jgi:hypothetical protein